jgi:hypothetical protein
MTERLNDLGFVPGIACSFEGRPAVVIARAVVGATGATIVGVRFTDVPQWADVPGFPGMQRPADGTCRLAKVDDLVARHGG